MNKKQLALKLAKKEKGKRQVDIAQITEILHKLGDMIRKDVGAFRALMKATKKKSMPKKASKRK